MYAIENTPNIWQETLLTLERVKERVTETPKFNEARL
jgi:hypothetical protein